MNLLFPAMVIVILLVVVTAFVSIPPYQTFAMFPLPLILGNASDISPDADAAILDPSPHTLITASGSTVQAPRVGQQVVIETKITNRDEVYDWAAVIITEVRDSSGITIYLTWQSGIVTSGGTMNIGMSWIPQAAGQHEFRTFAISDLASPRILSIVSSTEINVGS